MLATIHWKTKEDGGRSKPPSGISHPPYAALIRFKGSEEPWPPANAWSFVVEKIPDQSNEYDWVANVRFLMEEAPTQELRHNREFELFEGKKCVATGVVVQEPIAAGSRRTA